MFGLIFSLMTQPWTLIFAGVVVLGLVAYGFLRGWPALLKIAADGRTWMLLAAAVFIIGSANLNHKVEALQEEVKVEQVEADSYVDANAILIDRNVKTRTRAAERQRITQAQIEAPEGEQVDAVMDAIAAEDQRRLDADAGA